MNPIKNYDYTPVLGWSVSRYDKFMSCKRQYYYSYYAKYDPEHPRYKIDELKRLTTIPLETGNIVHDVTKDLLERLLKTVKAIDHKRFIAYARKKTEAYCGSKRFAEVYYGEAATIDTERIFSAVRTSLDNLLQSGRFGWLTREAMVNKQEWVIEPPGFGETRIDGMKAYCKVDFLFPLHDKLYILDWKTGKQREEKHRKQLIGYSCWASSQFNKDPGEIVPIIVYLNPDYSELEVRATESDIRDFTVQIRRETEEMVAFCDNRAENIPKEKELFLQTDKKQFCNYCNFRELCG